MNYTVAALGVDVERLVHIRNRVKLVCLILILLLTFPSPFILAACPQADINNDCIVNLLDFSILAEQWLQSDGLANIDGVTGVTAGDLGLMAQFWLDGDQYVIINEIGASNGDTITDLDGDSSDWIELYNPTNSPVNLQGWSLTTDRDRIKKWTFPAVEIAPYGFLVIFASGKDRNNPASQLHTNFQLDANGEYLALLKSDGTTVVHSFDPHFGPQYTDVSSGLSQISHPSVVINPQSPAKLLVPDAIDDQQISSTWTGNNALFDDSAWKSVNSGIGFDARMGPNSAWANIARGKTTTQSSGAVYLASLATDGNLYNYTETAAGDFSPWWKVDLGADNHVTRIDILNRSIYQERLYNIMVEILNEYNAVIYTSAVLNYVPQGSAPTSPGNSLILDLGNQPAGGISGRFIKIKKTPVSGAVETLSLAEVKVYGVDKYTSIIQSDIASDMNGINATCYLRIPFEVANPIDINRAVLSVNYDDGFAAYINGTLVASANRPATPLAYNSQATQTHLATLNSSAVKIEDFEIPIASFRKGTNILAIHGLNSTGSDISFLVSPTLTTHKFEIGDSAYFLTPTPGAVNGQGQLGFVEDTTFDIDRGFYEEPIEVHITTKTPGATIVYTRNGTVPSLTNGTVVPAPNPQAIPTAAVGINTTTVLRAVAFKENYYPSNTYPANTDTHTYIFLDKVISSPVMKTSITQDPRYASKMRQALTDLPTVSIADSSGFLQQHIEAINYPTWTYDEFPISIEWLTPDGSLTFQENAGAARFGGHWYETHNITDRPFDKWSYRIYFRKEYGTAQLKAPIYEGFDHGRPPTDTFDQLDLRAGSQDMFERGFYMSETLLDDTMLEMGNVNPHGRYVHLYINGTYWGVYDIHERWNADMVSRYVGGPKEDYESIKTHVNQGGWGDMGEPYDGDGTVWNKALILKNSYEQIKKWVDIQSYVDFMLVYMFGNSEPEYRCVGSKTEAGVGFLFWLNDPDGFTRDTGDRTGDAGPGGIFSSLRTEAHPDFMTFVADRIHEHLFNGGGLTETAMTEKLLERCGQIDVAFYAEAARWLYRTPDSWASARDNYINTILNHRSGELLGYLKSRGLYPTVVAPIFYINNIYQHGGMINSGAALSMSASGGTIWYTLDGSDPRLPNGQINPTALSTTPGPSTNLTLIPKGSTWKYLDNGTDQGTAWRGISFNDASWQSGPAELGYGDGGEKTVVSYGPNSSNKYITTYFRHVFNLTNLSQVTALSASLQRDDGAVVFLNGTEIFRSNMPTTGLITYTTPASTAVGSGNELTYYLTTSIDTGLLVAGNNVIAVEIHQRAATSDDISFDFELVSTIDSNLAVPINRSTQVKSRVLQNSQWSALNQATFGVGDIAGSLRISELMYHPGGDPNAEYIELKNIGTAAINLNLVKFANGVDFTFPDIELAGNGKIVVVRNTAAFATAYPGFSGVIAGQYFGSLDNDGDRLLLQDAIGTVVQDFKFKDGWYGITDGGGFTLTVIDPANTTAILYGEKDAWRPSTTIGGSPGADDNGPNPGDIVINEVLAHADEWPNDWIELYNTSSSDISIGGWYLSDNNDDDPNLMKYRIADNTTIAAGGYLVFTQSNHFGSTASDPGRLIPFALSENGDKVCLSSAVGGQLTGYRESESFGASEIGISLGRYYKVSTDSYNFVALSVPTPSPLTNPNPYYAGAVNAYPKVGPIVISEIMYHPPVGGSYDKDEYEYIELYNTTGSIVSLYDNDLDLGWTFTDGIDYTFAPGTKIGPYGRLVIARNIAAFTQRYGFSAGVLGPFENDTNLKNSSEQLQLGKPGDIDTDGVRQYIRMDRVIYSDGTHPEGTGPDLWPTAPDGSGQSLTRKVLTNYGNDLVNWEGQTPSPGL